MDTRVIRSFLRVAEMGNLTRAAESLGVSQPTLTRIIRGLETEAGVKLLERTRRGVRLSDAGQHLADSLPAFVSGIENVMGEIRSADFEPTGEIKVGIPHSMARTVAVPLVTWFIERFPKSTIQLQLGVSHEIEQALGFGQIDIGILISPQTQVPLVSVKPLATEPLMLLGRSDQPLAANNARWSEVEGLPLIVPPVQNPLRRRINAAAQAASIDLTILAEVGDAAVAMELVEKGVGYALLPESISREMREGGRITGRKIGNEMVVWTIAVSNHGASIRLRDAVEGQLRAIAATLATGSSWRPVAAD
ncbi:LysR family transcriptional regulator [Aquibium sp. LZ166]|uniref:LysR family transcriptional regulator n=1 Tax=Aquibium pacificus TaxID=3153579 RepID=A0ABV3SKN2_9HYPH